MIARALLKPGALLCFEIFDRNSRFFVSQTENSHDADERRTELAKTMRVFPDFVTREEEESILREIEPYMKRLRYEFSHWDDAIHGYRETERGKWNEENTKIIDRVRTKAFPPGTPQLGLVHVLDLAADGKIKPHVDSIRFCGDVIAGISLLSDSVMRLTLVGDEKYKQDFFLPRRSLYIMSGIARHKYNHEILGNEESMYEGKIVKKDRRISEEKLQFCGNVIAGMSLLGDSVMRLTLIGDEKYKQDFFLPRRSLYIMSGNARHKYSHEILGNEESIYEGKIVKKDRRISVICRSEPDPQSDLS